MWGRRLVAACAAVLVGCGGNDSGADDAGVISDAGTDAGPAHLRVFVTSREFTGDLGGFGGADGLCQLLSEAAGLGTGFRAFLSGVMGPTRITGYERLPPDNVWYLVDDTQIFDSWIALRFNDPVLAPIALDERGMAVPAGATVWTGMAPDGTARVGSDCSSPPTDGSWENDIGSSAMVGDPLDVMRWSSDTDQPCAQRARLLCFQIF